MRIPNFSRNTWLALGCLGVLARLWLWWFTLGSNDVTSFYSFGRSSYTQGIAQTYRLDPDMNHPPLVALYVAQAWARADNDLLAFARMIKMLGLLGEAISLWALWWFGGPLAFAVYSGLPAAMLIAGFHCNTDCLYAALVLLCALAFDRKHYFLSGLLLAAACNVKLLPVVLAPLLVTGAPNRRALVRTAAGLALGLVPYLPSALTAGSAMYHNIAGYNSTAEHWGILILLDRIPRTRGLRSIEDSASAWYHAQGRYIMLAGILWLAWLSRFRLRLSMTEQFALGGALFLVLTPGFGVQYVVLIAPLLCLVDLRAALLWGWSAGIFIASVYLIFMDNWWPAHTFVTAKFFFPTWVFGLVAWGVLVHFLRRYIVAARERGQPLHPFVSPSSAHSGSARAC